jgi:hypothetical protein
MQIKEPSTLRTQLEEEAELLRLEAKTMSPGEQRASILRRLHEIEMDLSTVDWVSSRGLQPRS